MNHTLGPWKIRQVTETFGRYADRAYRYIITENPTDCLAEIFPGRTHGSANARLIAAAPDLLEACEIATNYMRGSRYHTRIYALSLLENAIAKATGMDTP